MGRVSTARAAGGGRPGVDLSLQRELSAGGRVLHLGAGASRWMVDDVFAVSVDHVMLATEPRSVQVVADANRLPFTSDAFRGVLAKDVLEHLDDPIGALAELGRVSAPEARLIASVPRAIPRAVWDDPTHVRGFTAHAIRTAMTLGGWDVRSVRRIGGFPGAARLRLVDHLELIMQVPLIGHRLGRNWLVRSDRARPPVPPHAA